MTDILQLPGWTVLSTTDDGARLVIAAQYAKQPDSCQVCGLVGVLYKHGPRSLSILDSQRVSEHLGCDEKTVRNVAGDYIEAMGNEYKPYLPEWIGLDETHLNKIFRGIITDIGNGRPVDLLPGRDKPQLIRWFSQFPDRSHVKGLAIDMWAPYRDLAGLMFKDLPVVIDKFHVVKKAKESIERTRIRLGKDQKA